MITLWIVGILVFSFAMAQVELAAERRERDRRR